MPFGCILLITSHISLKVEGAISNTQPRRNTYKHLLILHTEHTLNHPNASNVKQKRIRVKSGENAG